MSGIRIFLAASAVILSATVAPAQEMSTQELTELLDGGRELTLGGEGHGYLGSLMLNTDGTGVGQAKTDSGNVIDIAGTWHITDDRFCRTWEALDDGQEVCETWMKTSETSVDVYRGDTKLGVNSW